MQKCHIFKPNLIVCYYYTKWLNAVSPIEALFNFNFDWSTINPNTKLRPTATLKLFIKIIVIIYLN